MANPYWTGASTAVWSTNGNWSPATAPADTDTATFDQLATQGVDGSDQSTIELSALYIWSTYIFAFGSNASPLIVDATLVEIGRASRSSTVGQHSGRINLSLPDVASTILVFGTKTSSTDSGKEPVRIKTGANANKLIMTGSGRVGIATDLIADTAQFSEIACLSSGAIINVGSGTTLTKWRQEAGTGNLFGPATTLQQESGTLNTYGSGAYTTINVGGTANLGSSGTVTALNINASGIVNMLGDSRAKTVTTITMYPGATLRYDPNVVTVTNPIVVVGGSLDDVTIETPSGITVAIVKT